MGPRTLLHIVGVVGRLTGHIARERLRRAPLVSAGDVPTSPADLTPEWLTAALCAGHPGARVESFERFDASQGTTTRDHLRVTYNEAGLAAGLPPDLYVKTTTRMSERLLLGLAGIIDVEGLFYSRVRPLLDIEAPLGYFASFDPPSWRSVVITEDIGVTRGARFLSPQDELTLDQAKGLVTDLAVLHGTMWEHPLLDGGWLQTTAERIINLDQFLSWGKRSAVGIERAGDRVPHSVRAIHDDCVWGLLHSMRVGSDGPHTMLHGDPHSGGNYFVTRDGRMGWGDWGVCLRGTWAYDYSYAVITSLTVEQRREWEHELLEHYLEVLAKAGGPELDPDAAWLSYRQQAFYPYVAWAAVFGHGRLQPDSQPPEYCLPIIERGAHAVEDLDSVSALRHGNRKPIRSTAT